MKINGFIISDFIVFLVLFLVAFYFRNSFPIVKFSLIFVFLGFVFVSFFWYSSLIDTAKNLSPKIIGDKINNSVRIDKILYFKQYVIFSEGGFIHDLFNSLGREGIIICDKKFYSIVGENILIKGVVVEKSINQIPYDLAFSIKKHFGYLPFFVKRVLPFSFIFEDIISKDETTVSYESLFSEINSLSVENNHLRNIIASLKVDYSGFADTSSAILETTLRPFKKKYYQKITKDD